MNRKNTLNSEDWIKGGFRALTRGGPEAIRVEAIARDLKVSKGSFYWHFKDATALKTAMMEHWAKLATFDIIEEFSRADATPEQQLRQVAEISAGEGSDDYGGLAVEGAIRDWARHYRVATKVFGRVRQARLQLLEELFYKTGADKADSALKARLFYAGLIGAEHLSVEGVGDMKADTLALLDMLLGRV